MKTTVASSLIAAIEYNPETGEMILHWNKGGQQAYHNVPQQVHDDFINAESVGKFYNQHIKGNPAYADIPEPSPETEQF